MRIASHVAALVALLAFAVGLGDFVSNPNVLGAFGLLAFLLIGGFAVAQLYGPERAPREPKPEKAPKVKRRTPKPPGPVWAEGWDASEAEEARQRRREERSRRKGR